MSDNFIMLSQTTTLTAETPYVLDYIVRDLMALPRKFKNSSVQISVGEQRVKTSLIRRRCISVSRSVTVSTDDPDTMTAVMYAVQDITARLARR